MSSAATPPDTAADEPEAASAAEQTGDSPSATELLAELGRDLSVLGFLEAQLALSRNMPEVRRAARDLAGAVVAALAFLTAFVFANVALVLGLATAMPAWLAALVVAAIWVVVGGVVTLALMVRAGRVTGWKWWRVFTAGPEEAGRDLEQARDEAEQAVRDTLERLAPALTLEIASAAIPMAGGVVDAGEDILGAADDIVESLAEDLPAGGVVNQVWDVVLMPGRLGLRVATTVLKRAD
jgi:hypothetical protein